MNTFLMAISCILILCLLGGLIRIFRGPGRTNRMLAAQLFGTIIVTVTLILSVALAQETLVDVALVLSLLASITVIAFLKLADKPDAH